MTIGYVRRGLSYTKEVAQLQGLPEKDWMGCVERSRTNKAVKIEHGGKEMSIPEWADFLGIPRGIMRARFARGWSVEEALAVPLGKRVDEWRKENTNKGTIK